MKEINTALIAAADYLNSEIADCQRDIANRKMQITALAREQIKDKAILAGLLRLRNVCLKERETQNKGIRTATMREACENASRIHEEIETAIKEEHALEYAKDTEED